METLLTAVLCTPRWLGWPSNMQGAVSLYANLIKTAEAGGKPLVRGLATDIANYTPREHFDSKFIYPQPLSHFKSCRFQHRPGCCVCLLFL